jgi:hypothetical protein
MDDPDPATPPVKPPVTTGTPQLYVVPAGTILPPPLAGVTVNVPPLQITVVWFVTNGIGFTVTVTVNVEPTQAPEVGVTVYVAVCAVLVGLVSMPVIEEPDPAAPPVKPPVTVGTPQLYVVPAGTILPPPLAGVTVNVPPLQITAV